MKKIKMILTAAVMFFSVLSLNAQYWSFETNSVTEDNDTVSAYGLIEYDGLTINGWVVNNSPDNSTLTGIWFYDPDQSLVGDLFVSEPWDFVNSIPNYMSNLVSKADASLYFGFDLDVAHYGFGPAIQNGETFSFSFTSASPLVNLDTDYPDVLFRWQQVGTCGEGSDKTWATFEDDILNPVPEPSTIALMAMGGLGIITVVRRRIRKS